MRVTGIFALLLCSVCSAAPNDLVQPTLLADTTAIQPGQPFRVGVRMKITPGWHIYWLNPGDTGIATAVDLQLPAGFTATPFQFPVPHRFMTSDIISFGYEDEVMFIATVTPPQKLDSGDVSITAKASWLVCRETCIPGSAELNLSLAIGDGPPNEQATFEKWSRQMPQPAAETSDIAEISQKALSGEIAIIVNWRYSAPEKIEWFAPPTAAFLFSEPRIDTQGSTTTITIPFERLKGQRLESGMVDSVLAYATTAGRVGVIVPLSLGDSGG